MNEIETRKDCPVNGSQPIKEGRVEVCQDEAFYTVCDDYWDQLEAQVVCKQLNFSPELGEISNAQSHCLLSVTANFLWGV